MTKRLKYVLSALLFSFGLFLNAQTVDKDGFTTIESSSEFSDGFEQATGDEFKSTSEDEFESVSDDEFKTVSEDEFSSTTTDEFAPLEEVKSTGTCCSNNASCSTAKGNEAQSFIIQVLLLTVLAGILVRFKATRNLRIVFLLGSLIYLGFIKGACPCPISSVQHTVLMLFGEKMEFHKVLYFLGLIPLTYVLGKTWCGWVCHLGAVQEFLHMPAKYNFLKGRKAQNTMRTIRWILFATLVVQLFIGREIFYCKIDPFLSIFNLRLSVSYTLVNGTILALLLLSSIFVYRPFCRTICPIGLLLGLVSKIPGASVIGVSNECSSCTLCNNSCKIEAITRDGKESFLDNQDCIACGECLSSCKKASLSFQRNGKNNPSAVICKSDCKI